MFMRIVLFEDNDGVRLLYSNALLNTNNLSNVKWLPLTGHIKYNYPNIQLPNFLLN